MSRKRKEGTLPSPKQDYKFLGILYPDSESYDYFAVEEKLKLYFQRWAMIVHDSDVSEQTGEPKKTHVHWVGLHLTQEGKTSPVALSAVAQALGVEERDIEFAKSEKASIRYLAHVDDPDKHQYPISEIKANFSLLRFFRDKCSAMKSKQIYKWICENKPKTLQECMDYIFTADLYAEFRRGYAMWESLIREVNNA